MSEHFVFLPASPSAARPSAASAPCAAQSDRPGDVLLLAAMEQLREVCEGFDNDPPPPPTAAPAFTAEPDFARSLLRVVEARADSALSRVLARWRESCAVSDATRPIEDDLFVTQRELRRSHAMVQSLAQAGAARAVPVPATPSFAYGTLASSPVTRVQL